MFKSYCIIHPNTQQERPNLPEISTVVLSQSLCLCWNIGILPEWRYFTQKSLLKKPRSSKSLNNLKRCRHIFPFKSPYPPTPLVAALPSFITLWLQYKQQLVKFCQDLVSKLWLQFLLVAEAASLHGVVCILLCFNLVSLTTAGRLLYAFCVVCINEFGQ